MFDSTMNSIPIWSKPLSALRFLSLDVEDLLTHDIASHYVGIDGN